MLNRKEQPQLTPIENIDFIEPLVYDITENVKLFFMKEVPNETCRIDLYFDAGNIRSTEGIPSFVNALLLSGTKDKTATQISNEIDALGGFIDSGISAENSVFSLYCLRENAIKLIQLIVDSIDNVAFHEKEVDELLADKKQAFLTNMEKVSYICQREFQQKLFYSSSDYSKIANESYYENISIYSLKKFFHEHYQNGLTKVVLVGNLEQDEVDDIIDTVGKWAKLGETTFESDVQNLPGTFHVEKPNAVQTAIRVGRILFNKKHEDYNDFLVLNTILGDYFGSRLMTNIREDKGYTYGIGSMVAEYNNIGYFLIATEVGTEVKDATLLEIQNEINRLKTELVEQKELELVKNYLLGQLLKSADGPYSMTDLFLSAEAQGFDLEFYNKAIHDLNNITPERIQDLAKKYLIWEEMSVVSAG
jgi:predicted Zn-dependent peptidase